MCIHLLSRVSCSGYPHKASGALPIRCSNICVCASSFLLVMMFLENCYGHSLEPNMDLELYTTHVFGLRVKKRGCSKGERSLPQVSFSKLWEMEKILIPHHQVPGPLVMIVSSM